MKNIAVIVTNLAGSGAEKSVLTRTNILYENGYNVVLFLLEDVIDYRIENYKFPIIPLTKRKNLFKPLGKFGDYLYSLILRSKMRSLNIDFDVIFSHLPRADRVVKVTPHKNKFFVIHMSYKAELDKFNYKRSHKKLKLYQYLYSNEKIVTVSKDMIEDFNILGIKYKSATVIYNPFDFDHIKRLGEEKIEFNFDYIISPSAFKKQKRYDVLLDAFKMVKKEVKLLILVKKTEKIQDMIKERGLENRVIILGFQQNPYKYIKNARLLVLSSDREGLPRVIIESFILGTPVVSTNCPTGPREIMVDELSKWLVPTENPKALAKKIEEALEAKIFIKDDVIKSFHPKIVYEKLKNLIEGA